MVVLPYESKLPTLGKDTASLTNYLKWKVCGCLQTTPPSANFSFQRRIIHPSAANFFAQFAHNGPLTSTGLECSAFFHSGVRQDLSVGFALFSFDILCGAVLIFKQHLQCPDVQLHFIAGGDSGGPVDQFGFDKAKQCLG